MRLKELNILNNSKGLVNLSDSKLLINTINAHSFNTAQKDQIFAEALTKGDVLIPDGMSVVWACKLINAKSKPEERIAGWDLFAFEMHKQNDAAKEEKKKCYRAYCGVLWYYRVL